MRLQVVSRTGGVVLLEVQTEAGGGGAQEKK